MYSKSMMYSGTTSSLLKTNHSDCRLPHSQDDFGVDTLSSAGFARKNIQEMNNLTVTIRQSTCRIIAIGGLTMIWKDRGIKLVTKVKQAKALVFPIVGLLHVGETWGQDYKEKHKLDSKQISNSPC